MKPYALPLLSLFVSCVFAGCTDTHAKNSSDAVVTHAYFPEHRHTPENVARFLHVPDGFAVDVFATGLPGARMLAVAANGDVFVTRPALGQVVRLRTKADTVESLTVAEGMRGVHGIALRDGRMYLATTKSVYVADVTPDGTIGDRRLIVSDLPGGGQHPLRTIGIGPDGMLYISVGSDCNACAESDREHATLLRAPLNGSPRKVFARGLRNTIGFDWHPQSHDLWGMDNGIDNIGDDDPPEELNRITEGSDYGWPSRWGNNRVNRLFDRAKVSAAELERTTTPPFSTYTPHSAPIAMIFYNGSQFPAPYQGSAFVAFHGSWNRSSPAGYKVVSVIFAEGRPERFADFLTGFLVDDGHAQFGRPAGLAVTRDGALLVSDDSNGVIYRVRYTGLSQP
jgi:glucose/arabinose dehydrogenase